MTSNRFWQIPFARQCFFQNQVFFQKKLTQVSLSLLTAVSASLWLTACQRTEPTAPTTNNASTASQTQAHSIPPSTSPPASSVAITPNHLTLYTSIDKTVLAPLLATFQKQHGITVSVVNDEPMAILARLKAESSNSPADMILTEDVGIFHQAIEAGLLQPFSSDAAVASVPARFRDPTGNWLALSSYARTAVYDSRLMTDKDISSYGDFAKPKWLQKLCLSQANFVPNQSLTVSLINNVGDKKAQEMLTGWVANLAIPVLSDDKAVMQAIDSGNCKVGLVNSNAYANYLQQHPQTPIKLAWANKGYGGVHTNITAVAIPKTAKNTQQALTFIEWLAKKEQQTLFASLTNTYPINHDAQASVLLKSWDDFEASPIAVTEYAEKQKLAVSTMKDAGWH